MSIAKALDADQRADALEQLGAGELDVLVVGGGIVGVGAALDAVTRGLKVGLVEQRDLASGTSSRSSKLVHGGLRYLEMFDFALVKEALEERGLLLTRLAPHLVRPVPFLYPLTKRFIEHMMEVVQHELIGDMLRKLAARINVVRVLAIAVPGRLEESGHELAIVMDAIERRDGERAARSLTTYVENAAAAALMRFDENERVSKKEKAPPAPAAASARKSGADGK